MVSIHTRRYLRWGIVAGLFFCHFLSFGQGMTVLDRNKKVITNYFDTMINSHDPGRKSEFFLTDYIWHTMDGKAIHSTQDTSHISMLRWLFAAIPDVHYTIEHILAQEDIVAVNTTAIGMARSEMFGLPPAQKKVHYQQMFFYRLKDGKIMEQWEVVDPCGIKSQLENK